MFATAYTSGDVDGSGSVDAEDLAIVLAELPVSVPAVPASGLLVLIATLAMGLRCARRSMAAT